MVSKRSRKTRTISATSFHDKTEEIPADYMSSYRLDSKKSSKPAVSVRDPMSIYKFKPHYDLEVLKKANLEAIYSVDIRDPLDIIKIIKCKLVTLLFLMLFEILEKF